MSMKSLIETATNEYAKRFYTNLLNEGYYLYENSRYQNAREKVKVVCPNGHVREVAPFVFNKGHRCKTCTDDNNRRKIREKYFRSFIAELEKDGYNLVGDYVDSQTPVQIKHLSCNHTYSVRPVFYLRKNTRCPKCSGNLKRTQKDFEEEVYNIVGEEYKVTGIYTGSASPIKMKHINEKCGNYEWCISPKSFLSQNGRCPKCNGNARLNTDSFKKAMRSLVANEYSLIGEYKNHKTPVKIRHNNEVCENYEWICYPGNFTHHGYRCPKCNSKMSSGERMTIDFLDEKAIKYEMQKTYNDLFYKNKLRYDFYLPDYNLLIEIDGHQHFMPRDFSGKGKKQAELSFKTTKKLDRMKDDYAERNQIKILRIPYWEWGNIPEILNRKIK